MKKTELNNKKLFYCKSNIYPTANDNKRLQSTTNV